MGKPRHWPSLLIDSLLLGLLHLLAEGRHIGLLFHPDRYRSALLGFSRTTARLILACLAVFPPRLILLIAVPILPALPHILQNASVGTLQPLTCLQDSELVWCEGWIDAHRLHRRRASLLRLG